MKKERIALRCTYIFLAIIFYLATIIPLVFGNYSLMLTASFPLAVLFTYLAYRVGKKPKRKIHKPSRL